jgi:hypothetical protein
MNGDNQNQEGSGHGGRKIFFSANHKRLLSLAMWAKYLAWVVLILHIFSALGEFNQSQAMYMNAGMFLGPSNEFLSFLVGNPVYAISVVIDTLKAIMNGLVYFLVLRGISLGLNMIVETDINYREKKEKGGAQ